MNINKYFYLFFAYFVFYSCGGKKYIKEIPYSYSSDEFFKHKDHQKNELDSIYTIVNDNSEGLNDDTLKIKEKYSIILGVMPKDINNYKLYSYIDEWLGAPYKKQTLEKMQGLMLHTLFRLYTVMYMMRHFQKHPTEFSDPKIYSFLQEDLF